MRLREAVAPNILIWISFIFYHETTQAGKTASKVGIAGIATQVGVSNAGGYVVNDQNSVSNTITEDGEGLEFKNEADRLKYELLIARQYDRSLRPVQDQETITSVVLDFTFRQILDLDEKNQVLKTYLWMKYTWTDEFLTWNETDYGGVDAIWLPATSLWRPDIVVYEETGQRDYTPRLPYYKITSEGRVTSSEPLVIETTCSVDILFFPFDFQRCSFTFTSWTFPSNQLDVFSLRISEEMMENIETYFLKTGEWNVYDVYIVKTSESFAALQPDVLSNGSTEYEEEERHEGDHHDEERGQYHDGGQPPIDTSHIRRMTLDITKTVQEVYPDRLTAFHWADIKYTFILRRNSSLYMQSMLFPAILLTTVAVLGFYLPPDSGERIGLQITIMLTFMVFLLTVGEMFPASTGPFLGVYYVLCMALLGVNLFMTVLVLHLHYMPSAAVLGTRRDGKRFVKSVPRWVQLLLRIAEFRFHDKRDESGRSSPTTEIVRGILATGRLSIRLSKSSKQSTPMAKRNGIANGSFEHKDEKTTDTIDTTFKPDLNEVISTKRTSYPGKFNTRRVSPTLMTTKESESAPVQREMVNSSEGESATSDDWSEIHPSSTSSIRNKSRRREDHGYSRRFETLHRRLIESMDKIKGFLQVQTEHLKESNICDDIENEWKAMSRTIDRLCMQTYIAVLILSHIIIISIALAQSINYDHSRHDH